MPQFMKSLNNISRAQETYRRERFIGEIPPQIHSFVLAICKSPGLTQDEIGEEICISKSMVSRRVDWLLERGYVSRAADEEDKRCLRIYPTEKMLDILPEVRRISRDWMSLITEGIRDDELQIFEEVLSKLEKRAREVMRL